MRSTELLIRADGGPGIGNGHWSRILSILDCLKITSLRPVLFTKSVSAFRSSFPEYSDLKVVSIETEQSFFSAVHERQIVLVDGYFLDNEFFDELYKKRAIVMCVDDLFSDAIKADVIVNHAPGISAAQYRGVAPFTSFSLGPAYSMVSNFFRRGSLIFSENRNEELLICMGGTDPGGVTSKLLLENRSYLDLYRCIHVIVGNHAHETVHALEGIAAEFSNVAVYYSPSREAVSDLMVRCGTAILPASTMALEYCHIGGLLAVIQTVPNQKNLYMGLLKEKVAIDINDLFQLTTERRNEISIELIKRQKVIFDAQAPLRFERLFGELMLQSEVRMRQALPDDAEVAYSWANDSNVRLYSFSKKYIEWEEHVHWFTEKIGDTNCLYLIGIHNSTQIGSIRFDVRNGCALISFLVAPLYQGRGLGRILICEGIKFLLSERNDVKSITGEVLDGNMPSIRVFERLGFSKIVQEKKMVYTKLIK